MTLSNMAYDIIQQWIFHERLQTASERQKKPKIDARQKPLYTVSIVTDGVALAMQGARLSF